MRVIYILLALLGISAAVSWAQGINPVSPATDDFIQFNRPANINPSNIYTNLALILGGGAPPALSGSCVVVSSTQTGGKRVGQFVIPAGNCATTTTITFTFNVASTNGWACNMHDITTPTAIFDPTAVSTTSVTFTIRSVNAVAADVVVFSCLGY